MKKFFILFLAFPLLLLSACGNNNDTPPAPADSTAPSETPAPTPTPDFSGTDFSGRWYVSEIIDSNGVPVSDAEKQDLDAGFTLELLPGGTYFVYDESGKALGQGAYGVTLNKLTLKAESAQTIYEILDTDTMRITQPDTSVTVMRRQTEECTDDDGVIPDEGTDDAGEGDGQNEPAADSSPATEPDAPDIEE